MKIEKINDNQIRCTLTKEDLATRELKLSELAYGTEKAKSLFRDMMQQAAYEFGFEANDIPLMIEAIPLSPESIILIITKVEDPEELDTRFAKFAPANPGSEPPANSPIPTKMEGADDILGLFNKLHEAHKKAAEQPKDTPKKDNAQEEVPFNLTRLYRFADLDTVIRAAHVLEKHYQGVNTLYHDSGAKEYHLIISKSDHTPEEFNKICNILSEYAANIKYVPGMNAFYAEHMECVIEGCALQKLASLA
ncbi:MAG: adaptor protein MecA [Candidatus Limivivens sp.]|nr:adaptor protein MecA [Candidatus Limivivens sp.]